MIPESEEFLFCFVENTIFTVPKHKILLIKSEKKSVNNVPTVYINEAIAPAEQYDPVIYAKIPCVIPRRNYKWRGT